MEDLNVASEAIMALLRGEDSYQADAGAYLVAAGLECLRIMAGVARG
jgi:hypothetical protein